MRKDERTAREMTQPVAMTQPKQVVALDQGHMRVMITACSTLHALHGVRSSV
jgi:hypothetical protein